MKKVIQEYIQSKNNLFKYFNVEESFYTKIHIHDNWQIKSDEDWYILTYWEQGEEIKTVAIVKKDGEPMIYRRRDYTMIVVIDCVKVGFIFKNINEQ